MYQFRNINEAGEQNSTPVDNMMINGKYINKIVPGYRQLYVDGRGIIPRVIDTQEVSGRDGVWVNYTNNEPRYLEITYQMNARSSSDLRRSYNLLNDFLRENEPLTIEFDDEKSWTYSGYLESGDAPPEQALSFVSSFTLLCPDPYKYGPLISNKNPEGYLNVGSQIHPSKIIVTPTETTDEITLINETEEVNHQIKLLGMTFEQGSPITFDWTEQGVEINYQGRSILQYLAWHHYPENFYLYPQNGLRAIGGKVSLAEWRNKSL